MKTDVFIVGSKGIPAKYGGFETFVENLTRRKSSENIVYHVSCMNNNEKHFLYNGADCFNVKVPFKGAPGRVLHVSQALSQVEKWVREKPESRTVIYILGCRIGPLMMAHAHILHRFGTKILVNPDGLEWRRDKWSRPIKKFLKFCEACLVKNADLVICDSINIKSYVQKTYPGAAERTIYIAYGADRVKSEIRDDGEELLRWQEEFQIKPFMYYLVVGRFVPENNYETIITEFMASETKKDLVIITNVEKNKFFERLRKKTGFDRDKRVKFVGTVYNQELLKKIREQAYGYIHGHEVGGTNPSLLEALASTKVNLLLDVKFNKEVGGKGAVYWNKNRGNLKKLIGDTDNYTDEEIDRLDAQSLQRVIDDYDWEKICSQYEKVFE